MTQKNRKSSYGLPAPITKLTYEQDLKMRVLKDRLNETYDDHKEDIITLFLALQKQNFVLSNSLTNLLKKWPKPPMKLALSITDADQSKSGISSESKNSTSTSET